MEIPVIRPSLKYLIYIVNYIISTPIFIIMLAIYMGGRKYSTIEEIIYWSFMLIIFSGCILFPLWNGRWGYSSMKFRIDRNGVTYIKRKRYYHMKWDEIQNIIFYPDAYGRITKNCFICFIADKVPPLLTGYENFGEGAFGVQWRKGLEEIIREYTDKPIQGIEYLPGRGSEEKR